MMLARQRRLPICWVRPFLTFGPRHWTTQLVPTLICGCLADEDIPLTPGEQTRAFLFVDDLCRMTLQILRLPEAAQGEKVNVCTGVARTIRSVAECIHRLTGRGRLRFGALPYRDEEAMRFYGSTTKFQRLFGTFSYTPFESALTTTIDAYSTTA